MPATLEPNQNQNNQAEDPLQQLGYNAPEDTPLDDSFVEDPEENLLRRLDAKRAENNAVDPIITGGVNDAITSEQQQGLASEAPPIQGSPEILDKNLEKQQQEKRNQPKNDGKQELKEQAVNQAKAYLGGLKKKIAEEGIKKVFQIIVVDTFPVWGPVALISALVIGIAIGIALLMRGDTPPSTIMAPNRGEIVLPTEFNPSYLMSNDLLTAKDTMTVGDIQKFLEDKKSPLATLKGEVLGQDANNRSAAQIIYDATRGTKVNTKRGRTTQVSINPQVMLVKLDKEQGLISQGSNNLQQRLDRAMGYNCPDGSHCPKDPYFLGFTRQVEAAGEDLMALFNRTKEGKPLIPQFKVGNKLDIQSEVAPNPVRNVFITNAATSVFYQYTPWVKHGNYNLWRLMDAWFRESIAAMNPEAPSVDNPTGNKNALAVPGIEEGTATQCGTASYLMTIMYYQSNRGTKRPTYDQVDGSIKANLVDERTNPNNWFTVKPNLGACYGAASLNNFDSVPKGWDWVPLNKVDDLRAAIRSVKAGDPVIFYSTPGTIFNNSKHIFVLTGYDDATQEFIINNPDIRKVGVGVRGTETGSTRKKLTLQFLFEHRGQGIYGGHTMTIRRNYL